MPCVAPRRKSICDAESQLADFGVCAWPGNFVCQRFHPAKFLPLETLVNLAFFMTSSYGALHRSL